MNYKQKRGFRGNFGRLLCGILSVSLLLSSAIPAFAEESYQEAESIASEESASSENTTEESLETSSDSPMTENSENPDAESITDDTEDSTSQESQVNENENEDSLVEDEENLDMTLFSNSDASLLQTMSLALYASNASSPESNHGLRSNITFKKYEIDYNKYNVNSVEYIVIHDSGNPAAGADAMAHYQYFAGGDRDASAHYFVDDHSVVQIIDDSEASWHCGVPYKTYATPISNTNSLGIELCINSDGNYNETVQNGIDLAAYLLWKYDLPMEKLVRHYDAMGKICPLTMSQNNWASWNEFKAAVKAKLATYKTSSSGSDTQVGTDSSWYYNKIMGESKMSLDTLVRAARLTNSNLSETDATTIAKAYLDLGKIYGIRGDIAFFQAALETGWFGSEIFRGYYNFCGLYNSSGTDYEKYSSYTQGVEAHLQHLFWYATGEDLPNGRDSLDPRMFDSIAGVASTWEELGGRWAVPGYDTSRYSSLSEARRMHGSYGDVIVALYAAYGGIGVETSAQSGSFSSGNYWDNPVYTGTAAGTRDKLQKGDTGSSVKELQGYLKTIGYSYVTASGTFDENTQRAIIDFQSRNGLTSDGIVGEYTWQALINTYVSTVLGNSMLDIPDYSGRNEQTIGTISVAGRSEVRNGSSGSDVYALQQILKKLGYNIGSDGVFGSLTKAAVVDFQSKNGLTADGVCGDMTWAALGKAQEKVDAAGGSTAPSQNPGSGSSSGSSSSGSSSSGSSSSGSSSSGSSSSGSSSSGSSSSGSSQTAISTTGRSVVYYGITSNDVKALQQILNTMGYKLDTDGVFGDGTLTAVKSFQSKKGLEVDGVVGAATWAALGKAQGTSTGSSSSSSSSGSSTGSSSGTSSGSSSSGSSSGSISASGRSVVYYGVTSNDVKALQQLLNQQGYNLEADGVFGDGTLTAVKSFQAKKGLEVDGVVGQATWKALGGSSSSSSSGSSSSSSSSSSSASVTYKSVWYGITGADVKELQTLLNKKGYSLTTDGVFGDGTYAAVISFQQKNGLEVDGIVGPATWQKLR